MTTNSDLPGQLTGLVCVVGGVFFLVLGIALLYFGGTFLRN